MDCYKCEECGELFIEPAWTREAIGERGWATIYESIGCCPYCGSDQYQGIWLDEDDPADWDEIEEVKWRAMG